MIIKKYVAKNEAEATALAKKELGDSAVIMNVKSVKKKGFFAFFLPSQVEITAAIEEESDNPPAVKIEPPRLSMSAAAKAYFPDVIPDDEAAENGEGKDVNLEAKLESLHSLIEEKLSKDDAEEQVANKPKKNDSLRFIKLIYNTLVDNEVDERYANELVGEIEKMNRPGASMDYILSNIYQKMILRFGQAGTITPASNGAKVLFFVGPTGVGKTTTIAKIASDLSVNLKKKVALLTTDTYRIAAAEQLKTYAGILNVPFRIVYTTEEIVSVCAEYSDYDYIIIDTAGHSPTNLEFKEATKQYVHAIDGKAEKDVYLVLSANTKYRDLIRIVDTYKDIDEFSLIFTKIDETDCFGNIWNIRLRTGSAIGYITNGQNVPDDIAPFNPQTVVKQLLGGNKAN